MPLAAGAAAVISGDTTPHTKPHPEPLLEAARRIGVSPADCLYVGDDIRDIQAGRAAGMRTVAGAMYGYLGPEPTCRPGARTKSLRCPRLLKWLGPSKLPIPLARIGFDVGSDTQQGMSRFCHLVNSRKN